MNVHKRIVMAIAMVLSVAGPALAEDGADESNAVEEWMIGQARAWAEQACGGKWVLSDLLADDFRGTSPGGARYGKPKGAPSFDADTAWFTDCRLDAAEVQFFLPDVAVMYGSESFTVPLEDGLQERRCLAWTDTWLKRNGEWQIVAAQDNRIECPEE